VNCTRCREAISARLDGEIPEAPTATVDRHLAACGACRAWQGRAEAVTRRVRIRAAAPVPDLVDAVLARLPGEATARPSRSPDPIRIGLLLVAVTRLLGAVPGLLGTDHPARELASWEIAVAAGLALAAWRPDRSAALLPMLAVAMALVLGTSILDVAAGRAALVTESHHLLDLMGLSMLWLLTRHSGTSVGRLAPSSLG
jgi:predicted anti-sigma-YlaC factor YlaD